MKFDYRMEFNASFRNLILIEITVGVCNFSIDTCKRNDNGQRITIVGRESGRKRASNRNTKEKSLYYSANALIAPRFVFHLFFFFFFISISVSFLHYNVIHF